MRVFEDSVLEEALLAISPAPTPIGGEGDRDVYSSLYSARSYTIYSLLSRTLLSALPVHHSTFHISKTLNHLSVLSRACSAVIDPRRAARVHVWHRRRPARRPPQGRAEGYATTWFVRASCAHSSWYGGTELRRARRDFEELPCGKVGSCLELPLGGRVGGGGRRRVSRAIRAVSAARNGYTHRHIAPS